MPKGRTLNRHPLQCTHCLEIKSAADFYVINKRGKSKLREICKDCSRQKNKDSRPLRLLKIKKHAKENAEKIAEYQKAYRQKNAAKLSDYYRKRHQKRKLNPAFRAQVNAAAKSARDSNPALRAKDALSARLSAALCQSGGSNNRRRTLDFVG